MGEDFFETAQQRVTSDIPRVVKAALKVQRAGICAALDNARSHRNCILHNPLAVRRQDAIIQEWIDRLLTFDKQHSEGWVNE